MSGTTQYFSFQTRFSVAKRNPDGSKGAVSWLHNLAEANLQVDTSEETTKDTWTGERGIDDSWPTERTIKLTTTLYQFDVESWARMFEASKYVVAAGTVTDEALPDDLKAGDYVKLDHERISALVMEDSTGTPVTLAEGTHYAITSAFAGMIEILSLTGLTQPLKAASYSYAETNALALFKSAAEEGYLMLDAVNTRGGSPSYTEFYRAKPKLTGQLALLNNSGNGTYTLEWTVLIDGTKASDSVLGRYGRMVVEGG